MYISSFIYSIFKIFSNSSTEINRTRRWLIIKRLIGYPTIIIICWLPASVVDLSGISVYSNYPNLVLFTCLPALQGFLTGFLFLIIFLKQFLKNPQKYKVESPLKLISKYLTSIVRVRPIMTDSHENYANVVQNNSVSQTAIIL